jgi:hypothetical protein
MGLPFDLGLTGDLDIRDGASARTVQTGRFPPFRNFADRPTSDVDLPRFNTEYPTLNGKSKGLRNRVYGRLTDRTRCLLVLLVPASTCPALAWW